MNQEVEKSYPNLSTTIICSLIFLGPILWLFINIYMGNQEKLALNVGLALIGLLLLILDWVYYIVQYRRQILFYAHKNGFGIGIVPILASFIIVGVFTLFYRLRNLN